MFSWRFILPKELIEEAKNTPSVESPSSSSSSKSTLRVTLLSVPPFLPASTELQTFANDARTQKAVIDRRTDDGWRRLRKGGNTLRNSIPLIMISVTATRQAEKATFMHVTRLRMSDPSRDGAVTSHVHVPRAQGKHLSPGRCPTTPSSKGSIEIKKLPSTNFAVVASVLRHPRCLSQVSTLSACPCVGPMEPRFA